MGTGVRKSGAGKQPCYCCDDNPSMQLIACHRQGHQPWAMHLICCNKSLSAGGRSTRGVRPHGFIVMQR